MYDAAPLFLYEDMKNQRKEAQANSDHPHHAPAHRQRPDGIDADAVGLYLCEDCLDDFASNYFEHDTPPEVAVINFATRELRPLEDSCPWFTFDNYLVDCTFEDTGKIDLRITYRPVRYQEE